MSLFGTALLTLMMQTLPLKGIVVRKDTTAPLSNATVELRLDQGSAGTLDSTTTEDDGRFSFGLVAYGRYRLTVTRRGYARPPLTITLAVGQPAEDIQLPMAQTGSISGRVLDAGGRPMGNVEVKAMKAAYPEGRRTLTPVQSVLTNDLGEYRLFWLAPGRYYVAAVHPKAQATFRRIFSAGQGISTGSIISGGRPDPALGGFEARQDLESPSDHYAPIFFGGTTDEQTATAVDLRENAEFGGVNFVVAPVQPRHVRGVVIDGITGGPARYGSITLPQDFDAPLLKEVKVDSENGMFDMLLFPGSYALTVTSASGEGYATFTLGEADIENLAIPTTPVFDIPGRFAVEGAPLSTAAAGTVGALRITLRRDPPRGERSNATAYNPILPDGSFTISATAGDFRINIAPILNLNPPRLGAQSLPGFENAYVKSIRLGSADVLNGSLHLDRPPSTTMEVVIATNPGALDGQVVRSGPGPVADLPVVLLPDLRRRSELYRTTTTDLSGRFHFDRVPPADYKVFSWEEVEDGAWYDPEFMKANESRGTRVRIVEGRTETARVAVIP